MNQPKTWRPFGERWKVGLLLAGLGILYWLSAGPLCPGDGERFVGIVRDAAVRDPQFSFFPHLLYIPFLTYLKMTLDLWGWTVDARTLILAANIVTFLCALTLVFFVLKKSLGGNPNPAMIGVSFVGLTFGPWFYLNGEIYGPVFLCLAAIFWGLASGRGFRNFGAFAFLGILHGLAMLLHQENAMFGSVIAVGIALQPETPWRKKILGFAVYGFAFVLTILPVYTFFSWYRTGSWDVIGFLRPSDTWVSLDVHPSVAKALRSLTASLWVGVNFLTDILKGRWERLKSVRFISLSIITVVCLIFAGWTSITFVRHRRSWSRPLTQAVILLSVWVGIYFALFDHRWAPYLVEYRQMTGFALSVFLALAIGWSWERQGKAGKILIILFITCTAILNSVGGVIPYRSYGEELQAVGAQWEALGARPDDVLVCFEEKPILMFSPKMRTFSFKGPLRARRSLGELFLLCERRIGEALKEGRRVYAYEILPTDQGGLKDLQRLGVQDLSMDNFREWENRLRNLYRFTEIMRCPYVPADMTNPFTWVRAPVYELSEQ